MPLLDILFGKKPRKEKKETKGRKQKATRLPSFGRARKQRIPAALRQQVWIQRIGRVFDSKCSTSWCSNIISVFDFECGHNVPESKGGETNFENLIPICRSCNMSMSNTYTFDEWCITHNPSAAPVQPQSQQQPPTPTQGRRGRPRKQPSLVQGTWCVPMFHIRVNPQN
jgi:5-methylcytosine-specific restriction endonuclease McrA